MTYIQEGQPEFVRATVALFGGAFVTFAELYATQPIMPELSRRFHVSPAASSLSLSVATAALAISMLWVSGVSDYWGRKRLMRVSLMASALLSIFVAISPSFIALLGLRLVQGVVIAGFPSIAMAYVNEEFHPKGIGRAVGLYVSGTSVGGLFWSAYGWIGVIGMIAVLLITAYLVERMVARTLVHQKLVAIHANAS
jgi:MFS transporter, YNFM family, putative membrane transport protein